MSVALDAAAPDPTAYRWMRPLALAAVAVVVTAGFNTEPSPGAHGDHLAVSVALAVFAVGTVAVIRTAAGSPAVLFPLFTVVIASASVLIGLQPGGPGFLGVFPMVSAAALRLPGRARLVVLGVAIVSTAVGYALAGSHPFLGVTLNEFGVVAFYLLATLARRLREANDNAQVLIAALEESRAAQAEAAALGERQRLAREMHDVLAHTLSGLVINLEGARLMAERSDHDPNVADAIGRAARLARTGLEEARRAISMLREDGALPGPQRLAELAAAFEADTGTPCTVAVTGDPRGLGGDANLTVYRVAQEALTNVRKHARAEQVTLALAYEPDGTRLVVEDVDGVAVTEPPPGGGTGYGLTGMRERAELLGGTLEAGPTDAGFRVDLWVPG